VLVDLLDLHVVSVGVAHIHAAQHRGPVLALRAAGASVDFDIAVVGVHLAGKQSFQLGALGLLDGRPDTGIDFGQRRLVAFGLGHVP
jgi:hypothetical protein